MHPCPVAWLDPKSWKNSLYKHCGHSHRPSNSARQRQDQAPTQPSKLQPTQAATATKAAATAATAAAARGADYSDTAGTTHPYVAVSAAHSGQQHWLPQPMQVDSSHQTPRSSGSNAYIASDTTQGGTDTTPRTLASALLQQSGSGSGYTPRAMDTDGGGYSAAAAAVGGGYGRGVGALRGAAAGAKQLDVPGFKHSDQVAAAAAQQQHLLKAQAAAAIGQLRSGGSGLSEAAAAQLQALEEGGFLPDAWSDALAAVHQSDAGVPTRRAAALAAAAMSKGESPRTTQQQQQQHVPNSLGVLERFLPRLGGQAASRR